MSFKTCQAVYILPAGTVSFFPFPYFGMDRQSREEEDTGLYSASVAAKGLCPLLARKQGVLDWQIGTGTDLLTPHSGCTFDLFHNYTEGKREFRTRW